MEGVNPVHSISQDFWFHKVFHVVQGEDGADFAQDGLDAIQPSHPLSSPSPVQCYEPPSIVLQGTHIYVLLSSPHIYYYYIQQNLFILQRRIL